MPTTSSGIYYETQGDARDEALVLIEGLGAQLIGWHPAMVAALVDEGYRVVLLDNRDVGLSKKYGDVGQIDGGYTIDDMAGDVADVLDDAGIIDAHVVGQSMGGIIAQRFAITYSERVKSLTLIYTTPNFSAHLRSGPSPETDPTRVPLPEAIERAYEREIFNASPGFPADVEWVRELAKRSVERSYAPEGAARQTTAIRSSFLEDQSEALSRLDIPSLIIHGRDDGYFIPEAALSLARALRHSELHLIAGMAHELPTVLFPFFVEAITRTARRAGTIAVA
ncbi:MAG: alpha/beta hydrolase [Gordonia sp. (in: high G+C Gram-positive bacteria)]